MKESDEVLLRKAKALDRNAISAIYDAYQQPFYRYIYRQVGAVETARDMTSDVFSRFLQALKNGNGPTEHLKAWLYRVAHNTVVDFYRRQQHRNHLALDDLPLYSDENPVRSAELHMDAELVRLALTKLTPDQRQVITLKFFAGFTNQETAEVLDKPIGAVKALQHRAIAALQRQLLPDGGGIILMNTHFIDSLDSALERVAQGEEITAVLHDYPAQAEDLAPLLQSAALLEECEPVMMPAPEEMLADQQLFISQMAPLLPPAVSPSPFMRLSSWMITLVSWLRLYPNQAKREQKNMGTLLLKATLILTIIFGSVGGTAVMAAESLPDSPLYPAKLMAEDARLNLAADEIAQAEVHLGIANQRLRETERIMVNGNMPEETLFERAENHIEAAFGLAEEMPVPEMAGILMQAQEMLQVRTRAFEDIEAEIPPEMEPTFNRVQQMLQNAGEVTAAGLKDPQLLRQRHSVNRPETTPVRPEIQPSAVIISPTQTITTPERNEPLGPCASGSAGCDSQGEGPYGPAYNGPKPEEPGSPAESPDPGEPNDNQPVNPDPIGPPEEPGNPDSGCSDCGQEGNQNGYGPQSDDSGNGSGTPGGSEVGIPIGGQSQNGTQYQASENNAPPTDQSGSSDGGIKSN